MHIKQVWYSSKTDLQSPDAIHQILMFGGLKDINFLKKALGKTLVKDIFLHYPKKIYTNSALNFIKNFILSINTPLDEQKYLKNTPRSVR